MVRKYFLIFTLLCVSILVCVIFVGIPYQNTKIIDKSEFEYRGDKLSCDTCVINRSGVMDEKELIRNHISNLKYNEVGHMRLESGYLNRSIKWNNKKIQVIENNKSVYSDKNYTRVQLNDDLENWINRINTLETNEHTYYATDEELTSVEDKLIDIIENTDYKIQKAYSINKTQYAVYESENKRSELIIKSDGQIRKLNHIESNSKFTYEFNSRNPNPPIKPINKSIN